MCDSESTDPRCLALEMCEAVVARSKGIAINKVMHLETVIWKSHFVRLVDHERD